MDRSQCKVTIASETPVLGGGFHVFIATPYGHVGGYARNEQVIAEVTERLFERADSLEAYVKRPPKWRRRRP